MCHEPAELARAHACQQAKKKGALKHPVFGLEQYRHLLIGEDLVRVDLWLLIDGQMLPKVVAELSLLYAPVKELEHVLPEPCLSLRREDPVRLHLFGELYQFTKTCLLSFLVFADIGRELAEI